MDLKELYNPNYVPRTLLTECNINDHTLYRKASLIFCRHMKYSLKNQAIVMCLQKHFTMKKSTLRTHNIYIMKIDHVYISMPFTIFTCLLGWIWTHGTPTRSSGKESWLNVLCIPMSLLQEVLHFGIKKGKYLTQSWINNEILCHLNHYPIVIHILTYPI